MMREDKVFATSVNIERFAQLLHGHDGALDVPAGASRTYGRLPEMLAGFRRFPQREVARIVLFVFVNVDPRPVFHTSEIFLGKLAVFGELRDAEVVRTV